VLVNAVINAFRLVDHVVVMTRGGPDNATSLLLYYIYEIGFRFWDSAYAGALTMVLLALLAAAALAQFWSSSARSTTSDRVYATRGIPRTLETAGAWLLGLLWILPLAYAVWTAFHPSEFATRFVPTAPLTLENFAKAWEAAPFARYLRQYRAARHLGSRRAARARDGSPRMRSRGSDFPAGACYLRWCWSS